MYAGAARRRSYASITGDVITGDGYRIKPEHNINDKVLAYSSITFGVVMFATFFYFYCSPLVKARRHAKASKRRQELLRPLSESRRRLYSLDNDSISNLSYKSKDFEPLVPLRAVLKDSVGLSNTRQTKAPDETDPFLSPPPRYSPLSSQKRMQSPFNGEMTYREYLCASSPTKAPSSVSNGSPPINLTEIEDTSASFVISGSLDSVAERKATNPFSSPSRSQNTSGLLLVSPVHPPRSSSLNNIPSANTRGDCSRTLHPEFEVPEKTVSIVNKHDAVFGQPSSPIYADLILPSYLRENSKSHLHAETPGDAANWIHGAEEYPWISSVIENSTISTSNGRMRPSDVQNNVASHTTTYTRVFVGNSVPKSRRYAGTELQFEMVKPESMHL